MKMIILQGPPGVGKTTWSHNYMDRLSEEERNRTTLICYDELKEARQGWFCNPGKLEKQLIEEALGNGNDVVVDSVNLSERSIDKLTSIAKFYDAEIEWVKLYVPFREAVERDKHRKRTLGENVIRHFYKKYFREQYEKEGNH